MIPVDTPEIDIGQLTEAVPGGAAIVGVREPGEYVAGLVTGGSALAPESPSVRFKTPRRQS